MTNSRQSRRILEKRFVRIGILCSLPVALFFVMVGYYLWSSISHYDNRSALLSAMFKLQFTGEQITLVGERSDVLLVKVREHQAILDNHLNNLGWSRVDWMGVEGQSRKGKQKMRIVNQAMTRYFRVIGLGRPPYIVRGAKRLTAAQHGATPSRLQLCSCLAPDSGGG